MRLVPTDSYQHESKGRIQNNFYITSVQQVRRSTFDRITSVCEIGCIRHTLLD